MVRLSTSYNSYSYRASQNIIEAKLLNNNALLEQINGHQRERERKKQRKKKREREKRSNTPPKILRIHSISTQPGVIISVDCDHGTKITANTNEEERKTKTMLTRELAIIDMVVQSIRINNKKECSQLPGIYHNISLYDDQKVSPDSWN